MNTIRIGQDERLLQDADPNWITQEINQRRQDGLAVCVRVTFKTDDLDFGLATPACGGGGGGRSAVGLEIPIFDIWKQLGLDQADFTPGNVVAFVQRVRKYL